MHANRITTVGFIALVGLAVTAGAEPGAVDSAGAARERAIFGVLDRYMDALHDLDIESHVSTYHFPHYRHASGTVVVWQDAAEAMPLLALPREERRAALRRALGRDWDRSEWLRREIVQASDVKAHVATRFVRLRGDGSAIATFDSLYVLTFEDGRWGIRGRSSFAP